MTAMVWRISRVVLGVAFLALGVVGLFLPFLQGILFMVIGLTLLSTESERARRLLEWARIRWRRHSGAGRGETTNGIE
jgi:uncharacterized membrane protein YbaN (DUF454 family)